MRSCSQCNGIHFNNGLYDLATLKEINASAGQGCLGCMFFHGLIRHSKVEIDPETLLSLMRTNVNAESRIQLVLSKDQDSFCQETLRLCSSYGSEPVLSAEYDGEDIGLGRIISPHSGSRECIDLAKEWYYRCISSHGKVCGLNEDVPLPTRLVYVPATEDKLLKLCMTKGMKGQYVALSYCWGEGTTFKTTPVIIEERMKGFPLNSLPQTLQDAVYVARAFGLEWIWIDALCIVQGDAADWTRESSLMAKIYGNSKFTICADLAKDTDEGFLVSRDLKVSHQFGPHDGLCLQEISGNWQRMCHQPLYRRGWAFQERLLASRTLHFLDDQIAWECNTTLYREGFRGREPKPEDHFAKRHFAPYVHSDRWIGPFPESGHGSDIDLHKRIEIWNHVIQEMSCREFTFKSDSFPAVSGLASAFQVPELGRYSAGVWEANPFLSIIWHVRHSQTAPATYIAPSWSWAWTTGQIIWHEYLYMSDRPKSQIERWRCWDERWGPRLLGQHVQLRSEDPKGQVLPGTYLAMSGQCKTVYIAEHPGTRYNEWRWITHERRDKGMYAYMDCWDKCAFTPSFEDDLHIKYPEIDPSSVTQYLCVQLAQERMEFEDNPKTLALVLERVEEDNAYERRGVLAFDFQETKVSGWERQTLRLM